MLMSVIYACFKIEKTKDMDDFDILSSKDMESMESSLEDMNEITMDIPSSKDPQRVDLISGIQSPFSCVVDNQHTITSYDHLSLHNRKSRLKAVRDCLTSLKDKHLKILTNIQAEEGKNEFDNYANSQNHRNISSNTPIKSIDFIATTPYLKGMKSSLEERIENINRSLEKIENGIEESSALLAFTDHFINIEMDRDGLRFAVMRVVEENHRMQEELAISQRRLTNAECELGIYF